jgi:hypothetical protein
MVCSDAPPLLLALPFSPPPPASLPSTSLTYPRLLHPASVPSNRHVYQKGYVEFFVSPEQFKTLLPELQAAGPQVRGGGGGGDRG